MSYSLAKGILDGFTLLIMLLKSLVVHPPPTEEQTSFSQHAAELKIFTIEFNRRSNIEVTQMEKGRNVSFSMLPIIN